MNETNQPRRMKKVIITGATGTIGMALIDELVKRDIEVTVISRIGSKRVKNIAPHKLVSVVECDFEELESLAEKLETDYDTFYYLAWQGSTVEERNDIRLQLKNIPYTLAAVNLAKKTGCKRFLGAGSQTEYGNVEGKISPNTFTNPNIAYGIVKLCAGQISRVLCEQCGIEHIWTRTLSVYGPYTGMDSVLMSSIRSLLQGYSPEYTKGEQQWDYLYSADAGRAFYLLGERGIPGKVYCIGSGKVKQLSRYLEILRDEINPEIKLQFGKIPYRNHQVMHLEADIHDLEADTGFSVQYTFEEGIRETIHWVKEHAL